MEVVKALKVNKSLEELDITHNALQNSIVNQLLLILKVNIV